MIKSDLKAFFSLTGAFLFLFVLAVCCTSTGIAKAEDAAQSPVITGIDVQESDSITEIRIDSNASLSYTIYKPSDPFRVVVELRDVGLGRFKDKMVLDKSGVMEIIPMEVEGAAKTVRLEIALSSPVEVKPLLRGNTLVLSFPKSEPPALEMQDASASADESAKEALKEKPAVAAQEEPKASKPEAAPQAGAKYTGEKISLDFQDADLLHIFRLLADVSGYNIVVHPEVKGKFSMRILNVPWDQALDIILRNYSLSKIVEGNIIRIAPTNVLAREGEDLAKAKEAEIKSGDIETRVYPINYADVDKVKSTIETAKVLTSMGFISTDKRTSSIIIKDVKEKHEEYE
ncbi:MAG: secretin and TonB N-terminal domain-containing protein, partial [Nitrospirae bacterium]|nr:secretin and TonB N-terminal domain-containing protein [Nitrospirota bacterium]